MKVILYTHLPLFMWVMFAGCLSPVHELYPEEASEREVPVYLISHGWHVGIAMETEYIPNTLPEHPEIPATRYLKFGWGDSYYYPHDDPGLGLLLRAALLPTESVLHVVGIDIAIESYFSASDVIRIDITETGAMRLAEFISSYFRKGPDGELLYHGAGLYRVSSFFMANDLYYFPKTSNVWTARALRSTGAPITPFYAITAGNLIWQAREIGDVLNQRR